MSSFPTNYTNYTPTTGDTLFPGIMSMQYGAATYGPYQTAVATVGSIALLNSTTVQVMNQALGELNHTITKPKIPEQFVYTTNLDKVKDYMVLRLYSPRVNRNQRSYVASSIIGMVREVGGLVGSAAKSAVGKVIGVSGDIIDTVEKGLSSPSSSNTGNGAKGLFDDAMLPVNDLASGGRLNNNSDDPLYDYLENGDNNQGIFDRDAFYEQSGIGSRENLVDIGKQFKYTEIVLPMPVQQIIDSHSHELNSVSLNPTQAVLGSVYGIAQKYLFSAGDPKNKKGYANPFGNDVGQLLVNSASAAGRMAFNPNLETLYRSPNPRQWVFTFNYYPTNKKDADNFQVLVGKIKEHSYPTIDLLGAAYNFPGTCDFEFMINDRPNSTMPKNLKPCFISDIQISYLNESGTYTHFWDGNPTSTNLTVTITETQLLSREDFFTANDRDELDLKRLNPELDKDKPNRNVFTTPMTGDAMGPVA